MLIYLTYKKTLNFKLYISFISFYRIFSIQTTQFGAMKNPVPADELVPDKDVLPLLL